MVLRFHEMLFSTFEIVRVISGQALSNAPCGIRTHKEVTAYELESKSANAAPTNHILYTCT